MSNRTEVIRERRKREKELLPDKFITKLNSGRSNEPTLRERRIAPGWKLFEITSPLYVPQKNFRISAVSRNAFSRARVKMKLCDYLVKFRHHRDSRYPLNENGAHDIAQRSRNTAARQHLMS